HRSYARRSRTSAVLRLLPEFLVSGAVFLPGAAADGAGPMRGAVRGAAPPPAAPVEWAVVALMLLALAAILMVSPALMPALKAGYVTNGGSGYQKLHPATYLTFAAFAA